MSLLTLSTITGYARTSSSLSAIGTATTLGVRLRVNGALLLDGDTTVGSAILVIGAGTGGTRLQVILGMNAGQVVLAIMGPGATNPSPVVAMTAASNITSGDYYVIRGALGPGGCSIALFAAGNASTPITSASAGGVTISNNNAANGYVKTGTSDINPTPRGIIDGIDVWSQTPPASNDAALPDASGLLWATYDEHGNIVWGATDLNDLNDASWGAGGAWDAPAPVVTGIDPDEGSEDGGTAVTISGQYFRAGATVEIGGNAATGVTVEDDSEITCTTPAGSEGAADVTVENPDGQSDTLENGFTYTSDAEPLAAGTVTLGTVNPFVVCATATAASGGTPPYSYQWQRSPRDAGTWSNLSGQTSLTLRDRTVTPGTQYDYRLLVTDDEEETAASNVIQPNVPAAFVSWGVLGDSNSDEYRGSGARGAGTEWESVTLNWTELLASPNGAAPVPTHRRDLDMGAWGSHGEPRRTGYAQMWARSGAELSDVISAQIPGLVAQIQDGTVTHAIIQCTVNEWNAAELGAIYNSPDGGVTDANGTPIATLVANYVANFEEVLDAVVAAGPAGIVVVTVPNYAAYPAALVGLPDATRRGYITSAISAVNAQVEAYCASVDNAEGGGVIKTVWWDQTLSDEVWPTLSGTTVTFGGVAIEAVSNPPDDANPEYLYVMGPGASQHASTLVCGIVANDIIAAANQLVGVSIQPFSDAEILENAGIEAEDVEGGSATSVEVVAVGAGSKAASAGSASDVNVYAAGAGSKTARAGSAVTVDVDAQGAGSKTALAGSASAVDIATAGSGAKAASGGSASSVDVTVSGAGAKHASGGSASSVAIVAVGEGTAEEAAAGGSAVTVSIAATGDGTKAAQGASPAGVDVSAQGAGSKAVSGGSGASVGIVATGGGTAAEGVSGGSVALVDVLATGGGAKATSGASGTSVEITTAQAGSKHASGGSASSLSVTATGGGTAEEVPPEGGSAVTVYVLTSGGGLKAVSLGSATLVSLVASGAGQKHASGGSAARVGVYTSAGGGQVLPFDVHPRNIIAGYGPGFIIAGYGPRWRF